MTARRTTRAVATTGATMPESARKQLLRLADELYASRRHATLQGRLTTHMIHVIESQSARLGSIAEGFLSAEQANSNVAAGTTEMATSLEQIEGTASTVEQRATRGAERLQHVAGEAETARAQVRSLLAQTEHISAILATITDLAQQTNILALNASIEAARAGEAGKGFAVVAQEVKALSRQTHQAAETIEESVQGLNRVVGTVSQAVVELGDTTTEIAGEMAGLADNMAQMHGMTREATSATLSLSQTSEQFAGLFRDLQDQLAVASRGLEDSVGMISSGEQASRGIR